MTHLALLDGNVTGDALFHDLEEHVALELVEELERSRKRVKAEEGGRSRPGSSQRTTHLLALLNVIVGALVGAAHKHDFQLSMAVPWDVRGSGADGVGCGLGHGMGSVEHGVIERRGQRRGRRHKAHQSRAEPKAAAKVERRGEDSDGKQDRARTRQRHRQRRPTPRGALPVHSALTLRVDWG